MATLIDTTPGGTARGRVGSREVRWDWTDAGSFLKWLQQECPISEKPAVQQPPFGCRVCRRTGHSRHIGCHHENGQKKSPGCYFKKIKSS